MKRHDLQRVAEALAEPMETFVRHARVRTALLVSHSGQILAQHGFTRTLDIGGVAGLAAASHASAQALAEQTGAGRWLHLHHLGRRHQLFLAPIPAGPEVFVLVAVFGHESTLGLVQLFFDRLVEAVAEQPDLGGPLERSEDESFESDLQAGLDRILLSDD